MINLNKKESERELSEKLGLSRNTIRKVFREDSSLKISSLQKVANHFNQVLEIVTYPKGNTPDCTTVAFGFRVIRDDFESWKIHLMDLIDEFRNTKDVRIFFLPPDKTCPEKLKALLAATVIELCQEANIAAPDWVESIRPLSKPWFVSGIESLKASAILESPLGFRSKNIFVQSNFLERA